MLLDGVRGMRMPVLKRLEWDIVRGERLVVDLEPREEVGDPVYGPDVRMFGWSVLRPGFALPKYHAFLGWLGATYRITTLSIKYLPGITLVGLQSPCVACFEGHSCLSGFVQPPACGRNGICDSTGASVPPETRSSRYWVHAAKRLAWVRRHAAFASRSQTSPRARFRRVCRDD
jgi:hypothetical protein